MAVPIGAPDDGDEQFNKDKVVESSPEKIEPKSYVQNKIFKAFVWASHKSLKANLNKVVLNAGGHIIAYNEAADAIHPDKLGDELSEIMGYIDACSFIILGVDENKLPVLKQHACGACCLSSCPKKGEYCSYSVEEYILRYAHEKGKWVLLFFLLRDQDDIDYDIQSIKNEMKDRGYCELSRDSNNYTRIDDEYRRFFYSWEKIHPQDLYILSPESTFDEVGGKDRLLRTLSACVQEKGEPRTIGQYTIESGEMVGAEEGDEIHIITNEIYNYDFTPMSSLTIAINTQKGVHYYYYVPADQIEAVGMLKQRIADYYKQSFKVKRGVVSWIRQAKSKLYEYEDFLNTIKILSIRNIVERLLGESGIDDSNADILNEMCSSICKAANIRHRDILAFRDINVQRILGWLSGKNENNNNIRSTIYTDIDKMCALLTPFYGQYSEYRYRYTAIKSFCDKLELLKHMKMLTIWHAEDPNDKVNVGERPSAAEIEDILDTTFSTYQNSKNEVTIPLPMYKWLKPRDKEGRLLDLSGELPGVDESDIESWLENIHCCPIADDQPYTLCYNFSLFLCHGGTDDADAAWYVTWEKNAQSRPNDEVVDNELMMIGFSSDSSVYRELKECYKHIILSNPQTLEEIKKSKSKLVDLLSITK